MTDQRIRVIDLETAGNAPYDVCETGWQDVVRDGDEPWRLGGDRRAGSAAAKRLSTAGRKEDKILVRDSTAREPSSRIAAAAVRGRLGLTFVDSPLVCGAPAARCAARRPSS